MMQLSFPSFYVPLIGLPPPLRVCKPCRVMANPSRLGRIAMRRWSTWPAAFVKSWLDSDGRNPKSRVIEYVPKPRFLDAAIPSHIVKDQPTELLVLIRLPDSTGLSGTLLADVDAEASPEDVRSKPFELQWEDSLHGSRLLRTECVTEVKDASARSGMNVVQVEVSTERQRIVAEQARLEGEREQATNAVKARPEQHYSTLKTPKKRKKPNVAAAPTKKLSDFSFTMELIAERNAAEEKTQQEELNRQRLAAEEARHEEERRRAAVEKSQVEQRESQVTQSQGAQPLTLRGHSDIVRSVAFSPDGKRLATASRDQTAKVWDAESGKELLTLRGHSGFVNGVVFSPDGKRLATASGDMTAKVWDAESGKVLLTLRGHSDTVFGVAFSPDAKRLATASADQTAKVWDAESGKVLLTLRGHSDAVF